MVKNQIIKLGVSSNVKRKMIEFMNIGELARATGLSTDTLRFYEKSGLIERPDRSANGYRRYTTEHAERVNLVKTAKALGFSLAEVRGVLPKLDHGTLTRGEIESRLTAKLVDIERQMQHLQALKDHLLATAKTLTCEASDPISVVL